MKTSILVSMIVSLLLFIVVIVLLIQMLTRNKGKRLHVFYFNHQNQLVINNLLQTVYEPKDIDYIQLSYRYVKSRSGGGYVGELRIIFTNGSIKKYGFDSGMATGKFSLVSKPKDLDTAITMMKEELELHHIECVALYEIFE